MRRHHDRFKPSNPQVTQQGRSFPVWGVILILALTTLACGLSATGSGSRVQRVVIMEELPRNIAGKVLKRVMREQLAADPGLK